MSEAPQTPEPQQDNSGRIAELEAELLDLRNAAVRGATVLLRVLEPHEAFIYAGVTVRTKPTPVPERLVPAMMGAARDAGVTLTEEV
jgi:hypothetical protein